MIPIRLLRVALLAFIMIACGDPTRPRATFTNVLSSYTLYALTGTPGTVPTAIRFLGGATRANSAFDFDVAFDLDASGRAQIFPVRLLGGALVGGPLKRIGLLPMSGSFESVREVPLTGYDTLSIRTVAAGSVLAVQLLDQLACNSFLSPQLLYAKLVVDSVNRDSRRIYVRTVTDPNCGYRMVNPDSVPTN